MAYISNRLVHWAGSRLKDNDARYELFTRKILKPKLLRYSPCPLKLKSKYGGVEDRYTVPMICFTDIPFSETAAHCERYSQFGISFNKSYLINCLACPVGYIQHPFIHQNFSYIFHALKNQLGVVTPHSGRDAGKPIPLESVLRRFMYMMAFQENYSEREYGYNEAAPEPLPDQDALFEDPNALYFEREWRMVQFDTAPSLPWHRVIDGTIYLNFMEKYLGPIIMPRRYVGKLNEERHDIFERYDRRSLPSILAYEDLRFM